MGEFVSLSGRRDDLLDKKRVGMRLAEMTKAEMDDFLPGEPLNFLLQARSLGVANFIIG